MRRTTFKSIEEFNEACRSDEVKEGECALIIEVKSTKKGNKGGGSD